MIIYKLIDVKHWESMTQNMISLQYKLISNHFMIIFPNFKENLMRKKSIIH
jgi:hypothetical protein